MSTQQDMSRQQDRKIDAALDRISSSLDDMKQIALGISCQLQDQNDQIARITDKTDECRDYVRHATGKIKSF